MYVSMAWRNMWRNRSRTLVTMASVFFAVLLAIVMRSFQTGVFDNLIKNVVSFHSGYMQVHRAGYWEERMLDNAFVMNDSSMRIIEATPGLNGYSPRLECFALASSGDQTRGCLVSGVIPERETSIMRLHEKVVSGDYLRHSDNAVMVGTGLAEKLHLRLHDTLLLLGQGYHGATAAGKYRIQALLRFGSPDLNDRFVFMPLHEAQTLVGSEGLATTIVLQPASTNDLPQLQASMRRALGSSFEVMTWREMMPDIVQHMETEKVGAMIFFGILLLLVSFGIFGTLLMMLAERQHEFGMLVAIGMKRYQLGLILFIESMFITVSGSLIGVVVSIPVVFYYAIHPIQLGGTLGELYSKFGFEPIIPAGSTMDVFTIQAVILLILGLLLSLYPVIRVQKLDPTTAMRK